MVNLFMPELSNNNNNDNNIIWFWYLADGAEWFPTSFIADASTLVVQIHITSFQLLKSNLKVTTKGMMLNFTTFITICEINENMELAYSVA